MVAAASVVVASPAAAQTTGDTGSDTVRITARKLTDGRVEFALQQQHTNTWGDRQLPRSRFFPTTATTGRWLNSSPVTVTAPASEVVVRITARKQADGRIEFALQQRNNDSWGDRRLPRARFFPTTATPGRWLNSSPLTLTTTPTYTAITAGHQHSCALRTDGTITCWGGNPPRQNPFGPPGPGRSRFVQTEPPDGQYTAITSGGREGDYRPGDNLREYAAYACALRTDGTIACWGSNRDGKTDPPDGQYTAITAGYSHA